PTSTPEPSSSPPDDENNKNCSENKNPEKKALCECRQEFNKFKREFAKSADILGVTPCELETEEDQRVYFDSLTDGFSTKGHIRRVLSPPGGPRSIDIPWSYFNGTRSPKSVSVTVYKLLKNAQLGDSIRTL